MIPIAQDCTLEALEAALDAASPAERKAWMRGLRKRDMARLYDLAEGRDVGPEFFLDPDGGELTWAGRNSLPAFSDFAKAFARFNGRIQGYNVNEGVAEWFGGPGHFLVRACGAEHGQQLIFDYTWEPDAVPAHWPGAVSNLKGSYKLVYGNMKDVVRRLSKDLIVSAAYRKGKPEGAYFCLVRP
ncbi:MAG: hypothetical protein VX899_11105 [Myxococcota bacterium]|nr:hypothetical protein [Myxococcota bacterium]